MPTNRELAGSGRHRAEVMFQIGKAYLAHLAGPLGIRARMIDHPVVAIGLKQRLAHEHHHVIRTRLVRL